MEDENVVTPEVEMQPNRPDEDEATTNKRKRSRSRSRSRSPYSRNNSYSPPPRRDRYHQRSNSRGRRSDYDYNNNGAGMPNRYNSRPHYQGNNYYNDNHGGRYNNGGNRGRNGSWENNFNNNHRNSSNNRMKQHPKMSVEPMDSYKVFMMKQEENMAPEMYLKKYEEYKEKYMVSLQRSFFDNHKKETWLQERYSPAISFRAKNLARKRQILQSKTLIQQLAEQKVRVQLDSTKRPLKTLKGSAEEENDEVENTASSNVLFDNDLIPSERIVYIRRVSCSCPESALIEAVKTGGSFETIHFSDPAKKPDCDFDRSAYVIYDSEESAQSAMSKLQNLFIQDPEMTTPLKLQVSIYRSRAPLHIPSGCCVPKRLKHDLKQSKEIAEELDTFLFQDYTIKNNEAIGIRALLEDANIRSLYGLDEEEHNVENELDLVVTYLRRVHFFVYYAATQCRDMGDLLYTHPAIFLRSTVTDKDVEDDKNREDLYEKSLTEEGSEAKRWDLWGQNLDEKLQKVRSQFSHWHSLTDSARAEIDEIEEKEEKALVNIYDTYLEKISEADEKHRCTLCTKLFKNKIFVQKHIRNKHPELVTEIILSVGEPYMWNSYHNDSQKPLPLHDTTNNVTLGSNRYQNNNPPLPPYNNNFRQSNNRPFHMGTNYIPNRGGRGGYRGGYRGGRGGRGGYPMYGRGGYNNQHHQPRKQDLTLPIDPRSVSTSYMDLDNLQDKKKIELQFDEGLEDLPPPPRKKQKATAEGLTEAAATKSPVAEPNAPEATNDAAANESLITEASATQE